MYGVCDLEISFSNYAEPLFDLTAYINNPSLSDVVLVSEDSQRFHAHRIVLCAQSLVLKTMLDSEVWADSKNKEVHDLYMYEVSKHIITARYIIIMMTHTSTCSWSRLTSLRS